MSVAEDAWGSVSPQQVSDTLADAVAVLSRLAGLIHRVDGAGLADTFTLVQELRRRSEAASFTLVAEAIDRGEVDGDPGAWIAAHNGPGAPIEPGEVSTLVTVARELTRGPDRKVLKDAVIDGAVSVSKARVCVAEMARLEHRLMPDAVPVVWQAYASLAAMERRCALRNLRPALLAKYGADDELDRDHARAAEFVALSTASRDGATHTYRLVLDATGHAVLEAALGPLAAPQLDQDGVPDRRPSARRRGDALIELVQRAVAASHGTPTRPKTQLLLTMPATDLEQQRGAAEVIGSVATGTLLPPSIAATAACSGSVRRVLLGMEGEVLDLGRETRLFRPGQIKALLLRDRICTFPHCTRPGTWADAHHLRHWVDGGPSDLGNGALLCGRHHTLVHRDRLHGHVHPRTNTVVWDLRPGSYDRALARDRGDP